MNLRPCTREELGLEGPENAENAKFYPARPALAEGLDFYWKKFYCTDDYIGLHGDWDSANATLIDISFVTCQNTTQYNSCKSEEEIKDFIRHLYIIHLHNTVRFDQTGYNGEEIVHESRLVWTQLSVFKIQQQKVY